MKWYTTELNPPKGGIIQKTEHPNPEQPGVIIVVGDAPKNLKPEHLEQIKKRTRELKKEVHR